MEPYVVGAKKGTWTFTGSGRGKKKNIFCRILSVGGTVHAEGRSTAKISS